MSRALAFSSSEFARGSSSAIAAIASSKDEKVVPTALVALGVVLAALLLGQALAVLRQPGEGSRTRDRTPM
jgi:hypothetical protein